MSKDRRLGRGLAALLSSPEMEEAGQPEAGEVESRNGVARPRIHQPASNEALDAPIGGDPDGELMLSVSLIEENPFQPRRDFRESEIVSLAESLKEHDMLQPVLVRRIGTHYQLISGERRLRAAKAAGWTKIPARIREADDRLVAELAIVENLKRKDLNAIEKALSFQRYLEQHQCTQEDLGRRIKVDRSTIANLMRLLELPPEVQDSLRDGDISMGHARALLPLGDRREQMDYARRIKLEGLSVRAVERMVSEDIGRADKQGLNAVGRKKGTSGKRTSGGHIGSLEQELRMALGTKVDIKATTRGKGRITIHFSNADEFERLRLILLEEQAGSE